MVYILVKLALDTDRVVLPDNQVMVDLHEQKDIGERLKQAMDKAGVTNTDLSVMAGVTLQAVTGWIKTGRIARKHLSGICARLNITIDWLLTGQEPIPLRPASSAGSSSPRYIPQPRRIPVINYIQAGHPREVVDDYQPGDGFEDIGVDEELAAALGQTAFALVVDGESMLPDFRPGDTVVIDPDAPPRPGDIVVAKLERDQAATLKKYRSRGEDDHGHQVFELVPLNDDYPTLLVNSSNPGAVIGPVVEHRRRLR